MKRTVLLGSLCAALLAPLSVAQAHTGVSVAVSTPQFGIRIGAPAPFYAPPPVYSPVPVYAPAPFYAPAPVFVGPPRVVYPAPVVVRRVVVPRPVYVAPPRYPGAWVAPWGYEHRHWKHRPHDGHDYRGHDRYRAGYGF